jgi:hypothetical protein
MQLLRAVACKRFDQLLELESVAKLRFADPASYWQVCRDYNVFLIYNHTGKFETLAKMQSVATVY